MSEEGYILHQYRQERRTKTKPSVAAMIITDNARACLMYAHRYGKTVTGDHATAAVFDTLLDRYRAAIDLQERVTTRKWP